jgi:hypothetical protein
MPCLRYDLSLLKLILQRSQKVGGGGVAMLTKALLLAAKIKRKKFFLVGKSFSRPEKVKQRAEKIVAVKSDDLLNKSRLNLGNKPSYANHRNLKTGSLKSNKNLGEVQSMIHYIS